MGEDVDEFRPRRIRQNREDLRLNQLSTVGLLRLARQGHARIRNDNRRNLNYIGLADGNSGHRADFGRTGWRVSCLER
jgi:hypothetical protein